MIELILLGLYITSIFGCRYMFRLQYKWDLWLKEDCQVNFLWFVPLANTAVMVIIFMISYTKKQLKIKNKYLLRFFNKDL